MHARTYSFILTATELLGEQHNKLLEDASPFFVMNTGKSFIPPLL